MVRNGTMWMRGAGMVLSGVCLLAAWGRADEVKLKNGDRLTGSIVKADGKSLTLKTEYAGVVTIAADAIDKVVSEQPLYIALKDGRTVEGQVTTGEGKYAVKTREAAPVTGETATIQAIRNKPEQDAYVRMLRPSWLDLWSGGLDFGYSLTTGNTRTNNLALGSNLSRTTGRDKTTLYAAYINAKNSAKGVSETTANAIRGGGRYEISLTNRVSAFGFADFEYNQIQLLDLRSVLGGGLGYYAIKRDRAQLQVFGGGSYNRENFSNGISRNSGEILAGEELTLKLSDRMNFRERLQMFPNLTNRGEYRVTFDSSLSTRVTRWLSWNVTASNRYLTNPIAGAKKNDLLLTTGVGVSFTNFNFKK